MKINFYEIKIKTKKRLQFIDITEKIKEFIKKSKIKDGFVNIFSPHTTCILKIQEKESCFISDFQEFIEKLIPPDKYYRHNDLKIRTENLVCSPDTEECLNGHAHLQHMLVGSSNKVIPIKNGKMLLGMWQSIFFIELDQARDRRIYFQVVGN